MAGQRVVPREALVSPGSRHAPFLSEQEHQLQVEPLLAAALQPTRLLHERGLWLFPWPSPQAAADCYQTSSSKSLDNGIEHFGKIALSFKVFRQAV